MSATWRAEFRDVGRGKRSWGADFKRRPTEVMLIGAIRKKRALGSRGIDFDWDGLKAGIYVGMIRHVGTVTLNELGGPA